MTLFFCTNPAEEIAVFHPHFLTLSLALFAATFASHLTHAIEPHAFRDPAIRAQVAPLFEASQRNWWEGMPQERRQLILDLLQDPEVLLLLEEYDADEIARDRAALAIWQRAQAPPYNIELDARVTIRRALARFSRERAQNQNRRYTHIDAERIARAELNPNNLNLQDPRMQGVVRSIQRRALQLEEEQSPRSRSSQGDRPLTRSEWSRLLVLVQEEKTLADGRLIEGVRAFIRDEIQRGYHPKSILGDPFFVNSSAPMTSEILNQLRPKMNEPYREYLMKQVNNTFLKTPRNDLELLSKSQSHTRLSAITRFIENFWEYETQLAIPARFRPRINTNEPLLAARLVTLTEFMMGEHDRSLLERMPILARFLQNYGTRNDEGPQRLNTQESTPTNNEHNTQQRETALFGIRSESPQATPRHFVVVPDHSMHELSPHENVTPSSRRSELELHVDSIELQSFANHRLQIPTPLGHELLHFELRTQSGQLLRAIRDYQIRRDPVSGGYYVLWMGDAASQPSTVRFTADFSEAPHFTRPPIDPQIASNLDRTRIERAALLLEQAHLGELASQLRIRLQDSRPVSAREIAQIVGASARYSYQSEGLPLPLDVIRENPYAAFTHFSCEGVAHFQCDGSNRLLQKLLNDLLQNSPHLRAQPLLVLVNDGSQILRVKHFHMLTILRVGGEIGLLLDATPKTMAHDTPDQIHNAQVMELIQSQRENWAAQNAQTHTQLMRARRDIEQVIPRIPGPLRGIEPLSRLYQIQGALQLYFEGVAQDPQAALSALQERLSQRLSNTVPHDLAGIKEWLLTQLNREARVAHSTNRRALAHFADPEVLATFDRNHAQLLQEIARIGAPQNIACDVLLTEP